MNKKYRLAPNGAIKTRYNTTEFIVEPRITERVSYRDRELILQKGTNILIIDDEIKISENELRNFVNENFHEPEKVFKRLNAVINPQQFKTIF